MIPILPIAYELNYIAKPLANYVTKHKNIRVTFKGHPSARNLERGNLLGGGQQ